MENHKSIHRNFGNNKPYIYQNTATMEPPVQTESEENPPKPGIPEHLKKPKADEGEQHVVFDEKAKQEARKMGFFQKLKATLFPAKAPKAKQTTEGTKGQLDEAIPTGKKTEAQEIREAEKIYKDGLATIKDLIAPSSMEFMYDKTKVSGLMAKSFFVYV